jgi:hypothetical protein
VNLEDFDVTAYSADKPLAFLEKAAAAPEGERAMHVVAAVRSMVTAGADKGAIAVARDFVKRRNLLHLGSFDDIIREARADSGTEEAGERGPSVATQLVELAQERYQFGISSLGEPFAIPREGPKIVSMLRGSRTSLRAQLAREYFARNGKVPAQSALADALGTIEGFAEEEEPRRLYLRCAEHDGVLWLDLGDLSGRAVKVTAAGWSVEDEPAVLFKRTSLTGILPEPVRGGNLASLWEWVNVAEDDRPLVAAEMVARLFSDVPHVVVAILGEHGTAKTTTTKVLVALTDPSPALTRKPPRDQEGWVTAAEGSWVVALDNLSEIPSWLSDSLCRASTGEGDVRRTLFKDKDLTVFSFLRCVLFNGIDVGALASDLADRTVSITLDLIPKDKRKSERAFWAGWDKAQPELLGSILTLACDVLAKLPAISLAETPRMADFALVLNAVDRVLGTNGYDRYVTQAELLAADSLSGDSFAARIAEALADPFEGTSKQLLEAVTPADEKWQQPKDWPADARAVTGRMTRLAPAFRKIGWTVVNLGNENHDKLIRWSMRRPPETEKPRKDPRPHPQDPQTGSESTHTAGTAGMRGDENGASHSDPQDGDACPKHATAGFGPHRYCPDCLERATR